MTYNFETEHDGVRVIHQSVYFPFWNEQSALLVTQVALEYRRRFGRVFVYERETRKEVCVQ